MVKRTEWRTALVTLILVSLATGCHMAARRNNSSGVRDYQSGQYDKAIEDFQKAVARDPKNADGYYNLAATYYLLAKHRNDPQMMTQAEGLYHQCLDVNPNHTNCYRGLAALLVDTNRPESAFTLLKRWNTQHPTAADPQIELARLYQEFGDLDNATRYLTDALHAHPSDARAWAGLGSIREQQGQLAQAMSDYRQAYNLNRNQPALAGRIATLQQNIATAQSGVTAQAATGGDSSAR